MPARKALAGKENPQSLFDVLSNVKEIRMQNNSSTSTKSVLLDEQFCFV
ncbi:MAG: hypothetical protein GF353_10655 [Candidatus Lokiarchaeota archaeon]|nr:hypothetical protein [Candidatus Lokiarchaeota archaeon]